MKKKKQLTILEMVESAKEWEKKHGKIKITYVNEPNMRLMAEGAINIWHHQTYDTKKKDN
jgi:hypothetical protein